FKGVERWIQALLASPFTKQRLQPLVHKDRLEDLVALSELVERGALRVHIDQVFALVDAADAIRYSETRRARGKVVIQTVD
ncbi:MAG: zinc-binding dehydrogenase, partial [Planctomycetes bacterium]|nr:zinc-binding dehydrogenase [Planctomycetota bacterium]